MAIVLVFLSSCNKDDPRPAASTAFVETVTANDNATQEVVIAPASAALAGTSVTIPPGTLTGDTKISVDIGSTPLETFGDGQISKIIKVTVDKPLNGPVTLRIPVTLGENQSIDDVVILKMREGFDTPQLQEVTARSADGVVPSWVEIQQTTFSEFVGAIPGVGEWKPLVEPSLGFRTLAASVWTGDNSDPDLANKMIIWGGFGTTFVAGDGGIFDRSTNSWRLMSNLNAPSARYGHKAIWTGQNEVPALNNKLIIWGGRGPNKSLDFETKPSGAIYDLKTDTWQTIETIGAPTHATDASVVWTGSKMIVFGGSSRIDDRTTTRSNKGGIYDPIKDSWQPIDAGVVLNARSGHSAVWDDAAKKMYVWGGTYDSAPTKRELRYSDLSISEAEAVDRGLTGETLALFNGLAQNKVVSELPNIGASYDLATGVWTPVSSEGAPQGRDNHASVWTGSQMVVLGGLHHGYRYTPEISESLNGLLGDTTGLEFVSGHKKTDITQETGVDGGVFTPGANGGSWTAISPNAELGNRELPIALYDGTNILFLGGSHGSKTNFAYADGGIFNIAAQTWTRIVMPEDVGKMAQHTQVLAGDEVLTWGGYRITGGTNVENIPSGFAYDLNESDPDAVWGTLPERAFSPGSKAGASAAWLGTKLVVWGGFLSTLEGDSLSNAVGIYDPSTRTWARGTESNSPSMRSFHSTVNSDSRMFIFGGESEVDDNEILFADGGIYTNSGTWETIESNSVIAARSQPSAVLLDASTNSEVLAIWGGRGAAGALADGAIITIDSNATNGESWQLLPSENAPSARWSHTAIYTGDSSTPQLHRKMIIWGGGFERDTNSDGSIDERVAFNDGAIYDRTSNTWTALPTAIGTSDTLVGRVGHSAVWAGDKMIVWGGSREDATDEVKLVPLSDGMIYDPVANTWTAIATKNAPRARMFHTAVWNGSEMIVFGGIDVEGSSMRDGGIYYPGTNKWEAISRVKAPNDRALHNAVWTGTNMIVWGGTQAPFKGFVTDVPAAFIPGVAAFPQKPTILSATAGSKSIVVDWEESIDAKYYKLYVSTDKTIPANTSEDDTRTQIFSGVKPPFTVKNLVNGTVYYCEVRAMGSVGESPSSEQKSAAPFFSAPQDLVVSPRDSEVRVFWTTLDGVNKYRLYVATSDDMQNATTIEFASYELASVTISHIVDSLTNGTEYFFQLAALDALNVEGEKSLVVSATPQAAVTPEFAVTATRNDGEIVLNWNAFPGATSYRIYTAASAEDLLTATATDLGTALTHTISGRTNGVDLYFVVKWVDSNGMEHGGDLAMPMVSSAAFAIPAAPTLTAQVGAIHASWTAVTDANGYKLYYYRTGEDARRASVINVGAGSLNATIKDLSPGVSYSVYLTVYGANFIESAASATQQATPILAAPQNLMVSAGVGEATVTWDSVAGATAYDLYWSTESITDLSAATKVADVTSPHTLTGLTNGTQYHVVVRATIGSGEPTVAAWTTMPTLNAPTARFGHKAVWTGEKVVLIGGTDSSFNPVSDVAMYTPDGNGGGIWETHTLGTITYGDHAFWTGEHILYGGGGTWGILTLDPAGGAPTWQLLPTENAHTPTLSSAVWTGERLMVWGGFISNSESSNTGATYSPGPNFVDGTWNVLPTTGAPAGRHVHSAVWTGTQMIVFGGRDTFSGGTTFNTGGIYTPDTSGIGGVWTPMSSENAPGLYDHAAIWTGTQMLTWNAVYTPDVSGGTWSSMSMQGSAFWIFGSPFSWTGKELIAFEGSDTYVGAVYTPDQQGGTWRAMATANAPSARRDAAGIWTGKEFIVWGGVDYLASATLGDGASYTPFNAGVTFEGDLSIEATFTPQLAAPQNVQVSAGDTQLTVTWDGVAGAQAYALYISETSGTPGETPSYVTATKADFSELTNGTTYYVTVRAVIVVGQEIIDGVNAPEVSATPRISALTPSYGDWELLPLTQNLPDTYTQHTAVWTGEEMVVFGGFDAGGLTSDGHILRRDGLGTWEWVALDTGATSTSTRRLHSAVWTGSEMITYGGQTVSGVESNSFAMLRKDGSGNWEWLTPTITGTPPGARGYHSAVWTGEEMLVFGGGTGAGNTNTTYSLKENTPGQWEWAELSTSGTPPSARSEHSAVWTGSEMLVFGGVANISVLNDSYSLKKNESSGLWEWAQLVTESLPATRYSHSAVWTGEEMLVFGGETFGGTESGSQNNLYSLRKEESSGLWDWTEYTSNGVLPGERDDHSAVWIGDRMIVFGQAGASASVSDTWTFTKRFENAVLGTPAVTTTALTWSTVPGAHGYNVYYSTSPISDIGTLTPVRSANPMTTIEGLTPNTLYYYVVTAINTNDGTLNGTIVSESLPTAEQQVMTLIPPLNVPANLVATAATGTAELAWEVAVDSLDVPATGYDVYYSTTSPVDTSGQPNMQVTTNAASLTGLNNGVTYYVVVRATNALTSSAVTAEVSFMPLFAKVENVATATPSAGRVNLTWNAISGVTYYNVYMSISTPVELLNPFGPAIPGPSADITSLPNGQAHYFVVCASDGDGNPIGYPSTEAMATPLFDAPANVVALPGVGEVAVGWDPVSGASNYKVFYASTAGVTTSSTSVASTSNPEMVGSLTKGTTWYFKVATTDVSGNVNGVLSSEASALSLFDAPTVQATPGANQIALSWGAISGATHYNVYQSTTASFSPASVTPTTVMTNSHTATGLNNGSTYYFRVAAANATATVLGDFSTEVNSTPSSPSNVFTSISTSSQPSARESHTAVWTGTEMVVWGGFDDFLTAQATGGHYTESTDQWSATGSTNAPAARGDHTAVYGNGNMIVWGGNDGFNFFGNGGVYNTTTKQWTPISQGLTNSPIARVDHTAVWTGTEMIIWGGLDDTFTPTDTGGRYNPSTNTWTPTSTAGAPTARGLHTAVWTGTRMIVWGGLDEFSFPTGDGYSYDPGSDQWTQIDLTGAPVARDSHTAVWTGTEMIIWGGVDASFQNANSGARYNPSTDSWTAMTTTSAPDARWGHVALWTGSSMFIWGGSDGNPDVTNTGGNYTPGSNSWVATPTTNAPSARVYHSAVWTGTKVIIWGGGAGPAGLATAGSAYTP